MHNTIDDTRNKMGTFDYIDEIKTLFYLNFSFIIYFY